MKKGTSESINLEHVACDLCGCEEYTIRYRKPDTWLWLNQFEFPVVECINCGLVYVNPRPTENSMSAYYPKDYHENRDSEAHLKRYSIQSEFLPQLKEEKILDIGCARGDWLLFLKNRYPDIQLFGVDSYSDKVKSEGIEFFKNSLPECKFGNNEFDIVTSWAVFEHLHRPGEYFREVSRILKPKGRFFFLVTNSESLYGKKAFIEDIPRHTYHFSEKILFKYAEKFGLLMRKCHYNDDLFDGRGVGTFYYGLLMKSGVSWQDIYFKKITKSQLFMGNIGRRLDRIVFAKHWEKGKRQSGIIIVEMQKP